MRGTLTTLLDYRFHRDKRTLITSNLNYQQMSELYDDDRLSSRLQKACGNAIEIGGADQRAVQPPKRGGLRIASK